MMIQNAGEDVKQQERSFIRVKNGTASLEDNSVVSYEFKHSLIWCPGEGNDNPLQYSCLDKGA